MAAAAALAAKPLVGKLTKPILGGLGGALSGLGILSGARRSSDFQLDPNLFRAPDRSELNLTDDDTLRMALGLLRGATFGQARQSVPTILGALAGRGVSPSSNLTGAALARSANQANLSFAPQAAGLIDNQLARALQLYLTNLQAARHGDILRAQGAARSAETTSQGLGDLGGRLLGAAFG